MDALKTWLTFVSDNRSYIFDAVLQHTRIVLIVVVAATLTSIVLGVLVQNRPALKAIVLAVTGIFLTIPSLALFALFIPLVGIGNPPAMLALYLYALLPVLRNTVAGLESVSPAVVESARGMGMTGFQQLVKVRLPLAWPIVMAGVRISTLLTVGVAAIAPLVGGNGLGVYIQQGLTRLGLPNAIQSVWVGIVFTVALGLVLDALLGLFQRLTTPPGLRS
ncbi:ABC transporter permease [soil metagenome]